MKYSDERVLKLSTDNGLIDIMGQPDRYGYIKYMGDVLLANEFGAYFSGPRQLDNVGNVIHVDRSDVGSIVNEFSTFEEMKTYLTTTYADGTNPGDFNNITVSARINHPEDIFASVQNEELFGEVIFGSSSDMFRTRCNPLNSGDGSGVVFTQYATMTKFNTSVNIQGNKYKYRGVCDNIVSNDFLVVMSVFASDEHSISYRIAVYNDADVPYINPEDQMLFGFEYKAYQSGSLTTPALDWLLKVSAMDIFKSAEATELKFRLIKEDIFVTDKLVKSSDNLFTSGSANNLYTKYWEVSEDYDGFTEDTLGDIQHKGLTNISTYTTNITCVVNKYYKASDTATSISNTLIYRNNSFTHYDKEFNKNNSYMLDFNRIFIKRPIKSDTDSKWYLPEAKRFFSNGSTVYFYVATVYKLFNSEDIIKGVNTDNATLKFGYASSSTGTYYARSGIESGYSHYIIDRSSSAPRIVFPKTGNQNVYIYGVTTSTSASNTNSISTYTNGNVDYMYGKFPLFIIRSNSYIDGIMLTMPKNSYPSKNDIYVTTISNNSTITASTQMSNLTKSSSVVSFPYVSQEHTSDGVTNELSDFADLFRVPDGFNFTYDKFSSIDSAYSEQGAFDFYVSRVSTHYKNDTENMGYFHLSKLDTETGTLKTAIIRIVAGLDLSKPEDIAEADGNKFSVERKLPENNADSFVYGYNIAMSRVDIFGDNVVNVPVTTPSDTITTDGAVTVEIDISATEHPIVGLDVEFVDEKSNERIGG